MLSVDNISVFYGDLQALWNVSIEVNQGEVVCIVGSNGAGKTTLLKTLVGLLRPKTGRVLFENNHVDRLQPHRVVELGVSYVPSERELFPQMTVLENLETGAFAKRGRANKKNMLELVFRLFPVLHERRNQLAGTMSGGEQQMLAIARGMMSNPTLLMLDEPSTGLAPFLVAALYETIKKIQEEGLTILLVEQNVMQALSLADRGYVLETGRIKLEGNSSALLDNPMVRAAYLGVQ